MVLAERWHVLGFTADQVVGAWQDARLAHACMIAWQEEGRPLGFRILQAPGEGPYLVYWFLGPDVARLLDAREVPWRDFLVGERMGLPRAAREVLREDTPPDP